MQWPLVSFILSTLSAKGHLAYLAGGCVRDALLGRSSSDLDIATDATPDQVESYFEKTISVGKSFGVIRVLDVDSKQDVEVASFRKDGLYIDGRRPESVELSDPKQDALRRDFTVNALFYDVKNQQLIDFVGGVDDLKAEILRAVGDPSARFQEDRLRVLRLFRFQAQLGFKIEKESLQAAKLFTDSLKLISCERIQAEIEKFTAATFFLENAEGFIAIILNSIYPEFELVKSERLTAKIIKRHQEFSRLNLWVKSSLETSVFVFWSLVFFGEAKAELANQFISKLKLSREAKAAIQRAEFFLQKSFWDQSFEDLVLNFHEARSALMISYLRFDVLSLGYASEQVLEDIGKRVESFPAALLSGAEVKHLAQGVHLGQLLRAVLIAQLKGLVTNKEQALEWAENFHKNSKLK